MAKVMKITAAITSIATALLTFLYFSSQNSTVLTLAIAAGTTAYHFTVRLAIGTFLHLLLKNRVDYSRKWFQVSDLELRFYQKIGIRKWKGKMPTYAPDTFDISKHGLYKVAQATCQSELVHETIVVFSFLPIAASVRFGALNVFLCTSILSAAFDLLFVFIQRFNRARILRIAAKH